jgi:hypothetical protein
VTKKIVSTEFDIKHGFISHGLTPTLRLGTTKLGTELSFSGYAT